jgi:hypothetical protein
LSIITQKINQHLSAGTSEARNCTRTQFPWKTSTSQLVEGFLNTQRLREDFNDAELSSSDVTGQGPFKKEQKEFPDKHKQKRQHTKKEYF